MKELKQICQVLLFLFERDEWLTVGEIDQCIDIDVETIKWSLRQLTIKKKIQKQKKQGCLTQYKFIEEMVKPDTRPVRVKCKSPVARAKVARIPTANCWRFAQQKIDLLERLKVKVGDNDRDLIIGMINDYQSQINLLGK